MCANSSSAVDDMLVAKFDQTIKGMKKSGEFYKLVQAELAK